MGILSWELSGLIEKGKVLLEDLRRVLWLNHEERILSQESNLALPCRCIKFDLRNGSTFAYCGMDPKLN